MKWNSDHSNDPLEHNNLINNPEYAHVVAELKAMMPKTNVLKLWKLKKLSIALKERFLVKSEAPSTPKQW